MLSIYILLGLTSFAARGYGGALRERQPYVPVTEDPRGRYTTKSLIERPTPLSSSSSPQQDMIADAVSTQSYVFQPNPSAQPASVPPTVACWATPFCDSILTDFAYCYNLTGTLTSPNGDDGRSEIYQRCLCNDRGTMYKNVLENSKTQNKDNVTQCYECMKQAGIDIDDMNKTSQRMKLKIHGFCNTVTPNLYDLLATFLTWLKYTNKPVKQNTQLGNIPSISTLSLRFTSASGMNEATTTVSLPGTTEAPLSSTTLTSGDAIPTPYLQQLPKNWPYIRYAAARRSDQTTSFALTNPTSTSETVAWLYHTMLWNPRPLFTPASAIPKNEIYQPGLRDWVPVFLHAGTLPPPTLGFSTTSSDTADALDTGLDVLITSSVTEVSDPRATLALDGSVLSTPQPAPIPPTPSPMTSVTSSTSTPTSPSTTTAIITPIPTPHTATSTSSSTALPTRTPSSAYAYPPLSITSQTLVSVLSKTPDVGDISTALSRSVQVHGVAGRKEVNRGEWVKGDAGGMG